MLQLVDRSNGSTFEISNATGFAVSDGTVENEKEALESFTAV
jgi:hypothetical protein